MGSSPNFTGNIKRMWVNKQFNSLKFTQVKFSDEP